MARTEPVPHDLTIVSLTPDTFPLFEALVDRHGGIFGGCWCTWFHDECRVEGSGAEGGRVLKRQLVEAGRAHAALAVHGSGNEREAIAWAEYGTPDELPNIHHRKQYLAEADLTPDYRVTCIFVDRRFRRQGLAETALLGALDLIANGGGGVVEGYPRVVNEGDKKVSASFIYNGTRRMYERCGFTFVRPKGEKNCVMRRTVRGESDLPA